MDPYLLDENVVNRLIREWKEYGKLVIAYDYDNTVFDYHGEGHIYNDIPELLRKCKERGAYLIVFSASDESRFDEIRSYLNKNNIPFDAINENPPFMKNKTGKIYYNILLDDRAGLSSAYLCLKKALNIMSKFVFSEYVNNLIKDLPKELRIVKRLFLDLGGRSGFDQLVNDVSEVIMSSRDRWVSNFIRKCLEDKSFSNSDIVEVLIDWLCTYDKDYDRAFNQVDCDVLNNEIKPLWEEIIEFER